ncbi:PaaI family thioesterase [Kitasatospora sp. MMS16-BH015]|uniref:PaaI family thioesterase n=1 Tax=Kitasatospora sp. MMS16-BH015 TaxID=2018025 RepID=UPI000CF2AE48|nr:PaaI family thioesterase [Kitasatospora sp. MMS16-BH015]
MTLSTAEADKILADNFAPWVLALGLSVEQTGAQHAVLRLPWSDQLAREGGGLSGQAMMAAADTACVIAICSAREGFEPMTTVQQSTTFQRPVVGRDVLVTARISKLGRRMAFLDITLAEEGADPAAPAAHATTVYAFPG